MTHIKVIIPAFNEQDSIGKVIAEIPSIVSEVIVVDNNSSDSTAKHADNAGATVLFQPEKGYGNACLKGLDYIAQQTTKPDIIVFLDGDYSDYPEELTKVVSPIINKNIDFVVGARVKELRESGAMTPQQVFGNWLATTLMSLLFKSRFTDLGPFRAIKYQKLLQLNMQLKALKQKLSYTEVNLRYKNRIGVSKVSGTVKGTIFAGIKILGWIFKYSFKK
jgi:glycosyltransferase involved in cell wall biosynthesis